MLRTALACIVALATLTASASAEPSARALAEARRRFGRGNQLYGDGRYEEALRVYLAAYELVPSLDILYNIALAREKVLDYEGCALSFREYLTRAGSHDPLRARAKDGVGRCRQRARIPLRISSAPAGAAISLGPKGHRVFRGRTPRDLSLSPGHYVISVALGGYSPMTQEVEVDIGKRPEIDFPLERLSSIAIEADVSGAEVSINKGAPQPVPLKREVRAGTYHVAVRKPGYQTVEREMRVAAGEQSTLMVSLPPVAARSRITVRSNRPADVVLGGRHLGHTPLASRVAVGKSVLEVRAAGSLPFSRSIKVPDDHELEIDVRLAHPRSRGQRILLWGLAGGAGVAAMAASVSGLIALKAQSRFNAQPSLAEAEHGRSAAHNADLLWGTSVVLGVATLVTYLATNHHSTAEVR